MTNNQWHVRLGIDCHSLCDEASREVFTSHNAVAWQYVDRIIAAMNALRGLTTDTLRRIKQVCIVDPSVLAIQMNPSPERLLVMAEMLREAGYSVAPPENKRPMNRGQREIADCVAARMAQTMAELPKGRTNSIGINSEDHTRFWEEWVPAAEYQDFKIRQNLVGRPIEEARYNAKLDAWYCMIPPGNPYVADNQGSDE